MWVTRTPNHFGQPSKKLRGLVLLSTGISIIKCHGIIDQSQGMCDLFEHELKDITCWYMFVFQRIKMTEKVIIDTLVLELKEELEQMGLWQQTVPAWVNGFDERYLFKTDFAQWLQFIFIPNQIQQDRRVPKGAHILLVPQALKFFGADLQKGKLLQILIEMDGML